MVGFESLASGCGAVWYVMPRDRWQVRRSPIREGWQCYCRPAYGPEFSVGPVWESRAQARRVMRTSRELMKATETGPAVGPVCESPVRYQNES